MMERWTKRLVVVIAVCSALLLLRGINARPTGYLHSWNQVSTLAVVRQLHQAPLGILYPRGVVASVTVPVKPGDAADTRFLNYQEFPLYHLLAAQLGRVMPSLEVASRVLSLLFWLLQWWALARLFRGQGRHVQLCADLLYFTSCAGLYYGQAIMSDIAMAAAGAWAIERSLAWRESKNVRALCAAVGFVCISSLFKSYGLIFALPVAFLVLPTVEGIPRRAAVLALIAGSALPVLAWHIFTFQQGGYQEVASHSFAAKFAALADGALYRGLWRDYVHYVGLIPGVLAVLLWLYRLVRRSDYWALPVWALVWLIAAIPYALLTLDKLSAHEYYLLPFLVPLLAVVVLPLGWLLEHVRAAHNWGLVVLLCLVHVFLGYKNLLKAQRENPDVIACADAVRSVTAPGDLLAILTDVSRYNSIAYYAERRGLHVEEFAFAPGRYRAEGAQALVIALAQERFSAAEKWLLDGQGGAKVRLADVQDLKDFRGKMRRCAVCTLP